MKPEVRYRRAQQTAWRTIADETVLLNLEHKRMYGLNPAAATVWQALDAADDLGELLRMAAGEGRPAFGEDEIATFLGELVALGLAEERRLTVAGSGAGHAGTVEALDAAPRPESGSPEELEPPAILWREDVEQIAGTCAMFPSTSPICNQVPFS